MMLFVDLVCMLSVGASVLRISFVIAKMVGQGEIGGHSYNMPRAHGSYLGWLQKDVGWHWLIQAETFLTLYFWYCRQSSVRRNVHWQVGVLIIES